MKKILTTCAALITAVFLMAQSSGSFWVDKGQVSMEKNADASHLPVTFRALSLDLNAMVNYLREAPMEFTEAARNQPLVLELPMPDGTMEQFVVWESPIMEPELAAAYPMIKTYAGKSLLHADGYARFDLGLHGFNFIAHHLGQTILISPEQDHYISYFQKDFHPSAPFLCGNDHEGSNLLGESLNLVDFGGPRGAGNVAVDLYTYRLAIGTTAEYSTSKGGTVPSVLSAVTTVVNQVNSIFEKENAIRLILISNTTETFFFPPNSMDPYTNGDLSANLNENQPLMDLTYGADGYDIGHVFGTQNSGGTIGLAAVGTVCGGSKARAASNNLNGVPFYTTVVHEVGHQFSALHNFNNCDGVNESETTAYEPGGGSTIMCYAGACSSNTVQNDQDDYFNINALIRIRNFSRDGNAGGSCAQVVTLGNNAPEVDIPIEGGFYIPKSTPFELDGSATDADGDNLTYTWEEYDLGPLVPLGMPAGTSPLFRSVLPSLSTKRVFPKMTTIVSNGTDKNEVLPAYSRVLTFRMVARDNRQDGGAWGYEEIAFNATANAGPFLVTSPNTAGVTWEVGQYQEVTWDVANSDNAPVNCKYVNIRLSKDGGFTYPVTLLANTPNDGSAFVVVPDEVTANARVRVEAADNIFFDISNANFSIIAPVQPGFALVSAPEYGQVCIPDVFEVSLQTTALLGFSDAISFSVSGLPAGTTSSFSINPVNPGEATTLTLDFTNTTDDNDYIISIAAEAAGVPVATRTVDLNVVYNNFSALATINPIDGASGQTTLPAFAWTAMPNALTYDIQIATDPAFANIADEATGLTNPAYTPSLTLEDDTPYFWRVRGVNECGNGPYIDPASFHTISQTCLDLQSTNQPINISGSGLPVIPVVINVAQSGAISDINLKGISGTHNALGDLQFRLKGPDGTTVILLSEPPCNSSSFNVGFDDQSPLTITNCPDPGVVYQPANPLSTFNGKDVMGDWTLEVAVVNPAGEGGTFQKWALEYCAALQSQNPTLVKNDTLTVPPGGTRLVYQNRLIVEDADNLPSELEFTIVRNTAFGTVYLNGQPLGVGDHFTMLDVYASALEYTNTDQNAQYDYFTFTVNDGSGGYFGTPRFNIKIDTDADPVAVSDENADRNILLYPNPAGNQVTIEFRQPVQGGVQVALLNLQGQQLQTARYDQALGKIQVNTSRLPAGMYLVQVKTTEGLVVKKLAIR